MSSETPRDPKAPTEISRETLSRRTRRSFLGILVFYGFGYGAWRWIRTRPEELRLAWPFRRMLAANEILWRRWFSPNRMEPLPAPPPPGTPPRINGDLGLEEYVDLEEWNLVVGKLTLKMEDIKALPRTESTCLFKCVEGWSEVVSYAGVRFSDFVRHYKLGTRSGKEPDPSQGLGDLFPYVGLKTPDGNYFVSLDRESLWHPQTVLAYEMNGAPLSDDNGAPLRLIIPIKYGIKSLKRVGSITFSDERPPDYWNQRGYDWYAGL